jgi:hypothetical protein
LAALLANVIGIKRAADQTRVLPLRSGAKSDDNHR